MLLPADLLSHTLMPWAMAAPALPLAFMISRKNLFSGLNVAILTASVTSILANVFFSLIMRTPGILRTDLYLVGILLEFCLAMIMLWSSTQHQALRILILAAGVMLCGSIASIIFLETEIPYLKNLLIGGHIAIACLALGTLTNQTLASNTSEKYLTDIPNYWLQAGHFFHFGSMAILLALTIGEQSGDWASQWDFALLFTVSTCIRFILFSAAVMAGRRQTDDPQPAFAPTA